MKKENRKLTLKKENVVQLTPSELQSVQGGKSTYNGFTCNWCTTLGGGGGGYASTGSVGVYTYINF